MAALSVVLVAERWETIRRVVACLSDQREPGRVELVVATPSAEALGHVAAETERLAGVELVVVGRELSLPDAREAGVHAATAPYVFLGETHVFPQAGFVDALLAAHARGYAAVSPAIENANPDGALSWAGYVADYGGRASTLPAREIEHVDPYNSSFAREALLEQGAMLPELLAPSSDLSAALAARGHRFVFEPAARIAHLNVSRPVPWVVERFLGGRLIAESRVRRWSRARRAAYALGSPLIPPLLVARTLRRTPHRTMPLARGTRAAIVLGAFVWAAGELTGYVAGGSGGHRRMVKYELDKVDYVAS